MPGKLYGLPTADLSTVKVMTMTSTALTSVQSRSMWEIDDGTTHTVTEVTLAIIGTSLCSFGFLGNLVNIVVFLKMGFKDTINISFFGLAVADIGCLLTQLWLNIMYIPSFRSWSILPFEPYNPTFRNLTAAWPHICFTRITGLITAYATFVRCLCIALPLKVKTILTPARSVVVIVLIFIVVFAIILPFFAVSPMAWHFSTSRNRSVFGPIPYTDMSFSHEVEQITYALSNVCSYVTFFAVILCTSVLISSLRSKSRWRQEATGGNHLGSSPRTGKNLDEPNGAGSASSSRAARDLRVIKLVVMISSIFICCFIPSTAVFFAAAATEEFSPTGRFHNLFFIMCSITYNLESVNSSVNIFIYFKMSTKYRQALLTLCGIRDRNQKEG